MATKASLLAVKNILESDNTRRFTIVSAPGKRFSSDDKVTDLLYKSFAERKTGGESFDKIRKRFLDMAADLDVNLDVNAMLDMIEEQIKASETADYAASRGEYLSAYIFAKYMNTEFIDAAEIIKFNAAGVFDAELTNGLTAKRLSKLNSAVIGGFYGSLPDGSIKTFSRGGSDVSGAIIARAVNADVYENWTDVNGFFTTDPRIVKSAKNIERLSYEELRELAYMGASVLHPESVFPVQKAKIPINIKNTFEPSHPGTMIVYETEAGSNLVTGIAGKKGYITLTIKKTMMNNEIGFGRKVLAVLEDNGISFEHLPTGIDTMSVVFSNPGFDAARESKIKESITAAVNPDFIDFSYNLALIAIVGHGMANKKGTAAKVFRSLYAADVNIKMIDQGSSEMNIIIGVEEADLDKSINAIYNEFFI